ncbi:MAG: TonB-dependent receptor plug domain-containing protein [Cyclobacteriaceae bacterium]|nr:TonB-dependent receptor plug domain-containing protein [Cyclobacteriaceae bacterium]
MNIYIFSLFILILQMIIPVDEEPLHLEISKKLSNYSWSHPDEKIYIHTDKSIYVPGEDIWLKAYLMIGPYHVPDTMSSIVYVELVRPDGTVSDRKIIRMREGLGWGDFMLPAAMSPGNYILKAYTRYMQNLDPAFHFRKSISILPQIPENLPIQNRELRENAVTGKMKDPDPVRIQFFPEGGSLVNGLQSYVAFKATGPDGAGTNVNGFVRNSKGDTITGLVSQRSGMGLFTLKPEAGESYVACISADGKDYQYEIPRPEEEGFVMHINNRDNKIYLWVRNNMNINMNNSFVIGQLRGFPFITIHGKRDQNFIYSVMNTHEIPSGIIHFTFFDSLGIPQCERLVYTENMNERIDFHIESSEKTYKKREKAFFDIRCMDLNGDPTLTNLSLSVLNTAIIKNDINRSHIRSYFNLESDLKGYIEDPGYYFNPENTHRLELLDILMLTHGWRRFVWKKILNDQMPDFEYEAERGFNIGGRLLDFYNQDKSREGNVRLFIYENQLYYNELETDEKGAFKFQGLDIYDSTHVVMQAWQNMENVGKKRVKTRNDLKIRIENLPYAQVNPDLWPFHEPSKNTHADYLELNDFILKIDSSFEGRTIILDELMVKDSKINAEDAFNRPGKLYKDPSRRIVMDSLHVEDQSILLFDILRKYFPGIQIRGFPPDLGITIRGPGTIQGNNDAMLFLDGIPVESDFLYYFPASEIAFIDLLTANKAAIYGSDAANGAIAFYTRQGPARFSEEDRMGMINFIHEGYYRAREFYAPDYDVPEEKHIKPDFRRTLYWNPTLTTDDQGNAGFSFYTSDEAAEYRVEIEGMTYSGIPFTYDYYFTVE